MSMLSNPDEVRNAIDWLEQSTADIPIGEEHRVQFRYAVVEAINNCIAHAYGYQADRPIRLVCETNTHSISVTIRDQGTPYTPYDDQVNEHVITDESGRGLAIINAWVSNYQRFRIDGWNITHLVRNID